MSPLNNGHPLEYIFHPRSIAIIGASSDTGTWSNKNFLGALKEFGFPGPLYPINPRAEEILGIKCYPSILAVPGEVDYVVFSLPAQFVPGVMAECAQKGVKVAQLYTAGFSETGIEEGRRLEQEIVSIARRGGMRIIGPNCIGIYCPATSLTFSTHLPKKTGILGYLSQSGGNAREFVESLANKEVFFTKVVSFGNAADLNESDFLEYLAQDERTRFIALYIEGVKEGKRFVRALKDAVQRKPVLVLKGGKTQAGSKAASSHTGSLAGSEQIWGALFRQAGAVVASDITELGDLAVTFNYLPTLRGNRVALVGIGGGASVLAADEAESARLAIPTLPKEIKARLREFFPLAGTSISNPVDTPPQILWHYPSFSRTLELVSSWKELDLVIVSVFVGLGLYRATESALEEQASAIIEASRRLEKPMAVVFRTSGSPESVDISLKLGQRFLQSGLPTYSDMGRACRAIQKFLAYCLEHPEGIERKPREIALSRRSA